MVNLLEQNIKCEKNKQQRFVKLQINLCLYSFDVKAHTWWPSSRLHLSVVTIHLVVSLSSNFSILTCNGMCMLVINHICIRWYNLIHIFSYVCILTMGSNTPHWSFQMSSRCWTGLVKYWNFNSKSKQFFLVVAGEHKPPPSLKKHREEGRAQPSTLVCQNFAQCFHCVEFLLQVFSYLESSGLCLVKYYVTWFFFNNSY